LKRALNRESNVSGGRGGFLKAFPYRKILETAGF